MVAAKNLNILYLVKFEAFYIIIYPNLPIRPNPDGQINTKLNSQIIDQMAELIKKWKAEFDQTAQYWFIFIGFSVKSNS